MRFQVSRQFFRWPCGAGSQLGEYLLDWIETWAVGRQEERLGASAAHGLDAMLRSKGDDPAMMSLSIIFNMIAHVSEIIDTCAVMEADGRPRILLADWARKRTRQRVVVLQHDPSNRESSELLLTGILRVLASELLGPDVEDNIDRGSWIFGDELSRFRSERTSWNSPLSGDPAVSASLRRRRAWHNSRKLRPEPQLLQCNLTQSSFERRGPEPDHCRPVVEILQVFNAEFSPLMTGRWSNRPSDCPLNYAIRAPHELIFAVGYRQDQANSTRS